MFKFWTSHLDLFEEAIKIQLTNIGNNNYKGNDYKGEFLNELLSKRTVTVQLPRCNGNTNLLIRIANSYPLNLKNQEKITVVTTKFDEFSYLRQNLNNNCIICGPNNFMRSVCGCNLDLLILDGSKYFDKEFFEKLNNFNHFPNLKILRIGEI